MLKSPTFKFQDRENAVRFWNRARKMMAIMFGDDNNYWVVSMRDGANLAQAGYEYMPL